MLVDLCKAIAEECPRRNLVVTALRTTQRDTSMSQRATALQLESLNCMTEASVFVPILLYEVKHFIACVLNRRASQWMSQVEVLDSLGSSLVTNDELELLLRPWLSECGIQANYSFVRRQSAEQQDTFLCGYFVGVEALKLGVDLAPKQAATAREAA